MRRRTEALLRQSRDTERYEARAALEHTREQLAQAQKMEALGQLTGGIAHDFNNILMIMGGHAQMLQRRLKPTEPRTVQSLEAIQAAAKRGESLTRQLLTFARRQSLNPAVVDLRQRIEGIRQMLASSLRGDIALTYDLSEDVWPVKIDTGEFELALVNITVNARDAMPEGGKLHLLVRNVTLTQSSSVGQLEGEFVALALSDTGSGIAPEHAAKVFEPFFTTKAVGKGTGLGLSQVYGFAHQSGGHVTATSAVGRGTTITLYLPRAQAAAAAASESAEAPLAPQAEGTVLVVEDNAAVADVTVTLIEQLGYQAVFAENAADALKRLHSGEKIDLVFSDIVMPGSMDGIALAAEVRRYFPDIPIILTSGYSDAARAAEMRYPILRKPFESSDLGKALGEALAKHAA
jgi:nitrogen-specific signal transduction histidine kinase/CheY-like chemotaxis protein